MSNAEARPSGVSNSSVMAGGRQPMGANRTALPRLTTAASQRANPVAPKGRGPRTSAPVPSRSQLPGHNPCIST